MTTEQDKYKYVLSEKESDPLYNEGVADKVMSIFNSDVDRVKVCIDVGAFHPTWLSNSYDLEQTGWEVHCVEPNPYCISILKEQRKNVYEYACSDYNKDDEELYIYRQEGIIGDASGTGLIEHSDEYTKSLLAETIKVKVRTLDWLIENELHIDHLDFLSIDAEHNEVAVLRGIDFNRWKPKVVVVESLNELEREQQRSILSVFGYKLSTTLVFNDLYIMDIGE